MKQIIKIVLSALAVVLSVLLGMNAEKLFVRNLDLVTIPIPNQEISPYTILSEDMFTTKEFSSFIKDFDYAESYSQLAGRMTTSTLAAGLPVPMTFISQSTGFYLDDPKLEIVSLPISPAQMLGGNIFPEQSINLYIKENSTSSTSMFSLDDEKDSGITKIANLKVSAVLDQYGNDIYSSEKNRPSDGVASILVLAVRPDQTSRIVEAATALQEENPSVSVWVTIANSK